MYKTVKTVNTIKTVKTINTAMKANAVWGADTLNFAYTLP